MLIRIPGLLDVTTCQDFSARLDAAQWVDGGATAGPGPGKVKRNRQLATDDPLARPLGETIVRALQANPLFISAALPRRILPPMFNCYEGNETYGRHIDGAIRQNPGSNQRIRADLSATLFLSAPDSYEGGELEVEDTFGTRRVKLDAGDMLLYPATSVHGVCPVTGGKRLAAILWIQSMVREDPQRQLLYQLDQATQKVARAGGNDGADTDLAGVYHNLLRHWADI